MHKGTMCTCGTDIATQHKTPANISKIWVCLLLIDNFRVELTFFSTSKFCMFSFDFGFFSPKKKNKIGMQMLHTIAIKKCALFHWPSIKKSLIKNGHTAPHKCCPLATRETARPFLW